MFYTRRCRHHNLSEDHTLSRLSDLLPHPLSEIRATFLNSTTRGGVFASAGDWPQGVLLFFFLARRFDHEQMVFLFLSVPHMTCLDMIVIHRSSNVTFFAQYNYHLSFCAKSERSPRVGNKSIYLWVLLLVATSAVGVIIPAFSSFVKHSVCKFGHASGFDLNLSVWVGGLVRSRWCDQNLRVWHEKIVIWAD